MKQFIILLVIIVSLCTAPYGQGEEGAAQSTAFQIDQNRLLNRFADLKPFKPDKGEPGPGNAFVVTSEEFRKSLLFLSEEKADEVMESFVGAAGFSFKDNSEFLMLTQWKDPTSAQGFMKVEEELWRLKDKEYQQYLKEVIYGEIDITKDEQALLTRKTIEQVGQRHDATTFVSARGNYLFECTLIGSYKDKDVKKFILQIWKIIESEEQ